MSSETAIHVQNLSKCFQIYNAPRDRLKQFIFPRLQRLGGQLPKCYYREFWALKDVSFEIRKGETVGIVGRNGSGKSTLLQLICGTLTSTCGNVETNGRVAALLELGAGFNPEFTGRENVYMSAAIMGLKQYEIDAKFEEIAAFAEIGEFIERPVKTLSSGMYVRLAFAVQVCVDPDILIVDEALAVGDAYFVHRCFHRLREMKAHGKTVIFVSHDANSVKTLCDRAILLESGEVTMIGQPDEVITKYRARLFNTQQGLPAATSVANSQRAGDDGRDIQPEGRLSAELRIPNIDQRVGLGRCLIQGVGLYDAETFAPITELEGGKNFILRISIVNGTLPEGTPLIVGFTFLGTRGEEFCGVNTQMESVDVFAPPSGVPITLRAEIALPYFIQGNYALRVSVHVDEQPEDRIENAIVFGVRNSRQVFGQMRFDTSFIVEEHPNRVSKQ